LQWTGCESNPQPLGYESDTLPLNHCTVLSRTTWWQATLMAALYLPSAAYAVVWYRSSCSSVCLNVRLSVAFVHSVKTNKHIFNFFSRSGSNAILVFPYQTFRQYFDGRRGPSNCGKNRDFRPIYGFRIYRSLLDRRVLSTFRWWSIAYGTYACVVRLPLSTKAAAPRITESCL